MEPQILAVDPGEKRNHHPSLLLVQGRYGEA